MNARPITTALLLGLLPAAAALASPDPTDRIPTLPAVQVRPDAEQRLELLARKVVDLAAVEVRPDALTLLQAAGFVPTNLERWIDIPALPSLPSRPLVRLPYEVLPSVLYR